MGLGVAPVPQHEEKAPYFMNSGCLLTEGGVFLQESGTHEVWMGGRVS